MTTDTSNGWIQLHRQLLNWEWYNHIPTKVLFIHCLLRANHTDSNWRGQKVKRGQFITSISNLSNETGLSEKQIRNALKNLEKTGEVGKQSTRQNSIITIVSYDNYQTKGEQRANEGQTRGKQRATDNNDNNNNNEKKIKEINKENILSIEKNEMFNIWLDYRNEINKPIKSDKTLKILIKKFEEKSINQIRFVVYNSIENNYQGLFWDSYKEPSTFKKPNIAL